jgi:L-ascorbate metabolism protein UlaG (beta-lactamase superfamily)
MRVRWFGHSAFLLSDGERRVAIDPWGDTESLGRRGVQFAYPPLEGIEADLVLISHEHLDHNGAEAVAGDPQVIRATAGRFESEVTEVVGIASEHDQVAGTQRGQNTIFAFELGGTRVCHLGDFGQAELRDEQEAAIGGPDLLLIPVGGGPTIGAQAAAEIVRTLSPRVAVPMHYRTRWADFVEPVDPFLDELSGLEVRRLDEPAFVVEEFTAGPGETVIVVPALPEG